jgi:hypothetical protein
MIDSKKYLKFCNSSLEFTLSIELFINNLKFSPECPLELEYATLDLSILTKEGQSLLDKIHKNGKV